MIGDKLSQLLSDYLEKNPPLKDYIEMNKNLQQELDKYKAKEKELRDFISKSKNTKIINGYGSGIRELDMKIKTLLEDSILDILDRKE